MITKEQVLNASSQPKKITVPVLGDVFIRLISEEQALSAGKSTGPEVRAKMACYSLCNEDGERIFEDGDVDEITKQLKFVSILEIFTQSIEHNGLMTSEAEEEPVKN